MAIVIPPRIDGDIELIVSGGDRITGDYTVFGPIAEAADGSLLQFDISTDYIARATRSGDEFSFLDVDVASGVGPGTGRIFCRFDDGRVLVAGPNTNELSVVELDAGVAEWSTPVVSDFDISSASWDSVFVAMDDTHAVVLVQDSGANRLRLEFIESEPGLDPVTSFTGLTIGALPQAGGFLATDEPILVRVGPTKVLVAWTDWSFDLYGLSASEKRNRCLYAQLVDVDLSTGAFTTASNVMRFVFGIPSRGHIQPLWYPASDGDGGVLVLVSNEYASPYEPTIGEIMARSLVVTGNAITEGHSGLQIARTYLEPTVAGGTTADFLAPRWYEFAALGAGNRGVVVWPAVDFATLDTSDPDAYVVVNMPIRYTKFVVDTHAHRKGGLRFDYTDELIPATSDSHEIYTQSVSIRTGSGQGIAQFQQYFNDYDDTAWWFVIAREPT